MREGQRVGRRVFVVTHRPASSTEGRKAWRAGSQSSGPGWAGGVEQSDKPAVCVAEHGHPAAHPSLITRRPDTTRSEKATAKPTWSPTLPPP